MTATTFLKAFNAAFVRLDDGTNFVNIADIKDAIGCNQSTLENFLLKMRMGGAIHLIRGNGRAGGYTERELSAGIEEQGHLLLYVSKKD